MRIRIAAAITVLLGVTLLAIWLSKSPAPSSASDPRLHGLEICFGSDDMPHMNYYGSGDSTYRGASSVDPRALLWELRLDAMHLPVGASYTYDDNPYIDCRVRGKLVRSGKDGKNIDLTLEIDSKVPFELKLYGMPPEGKVDSGEDLSSFEPGQHSFKFRGSISRWYEVEDE